MQDSTPKWLPWSLGGGLVLILGVQILNTWQIDRLEDRLIEIRVSGGSRGGGGGADPGGPKAPAGEPGKSTGISVNGWGETAAEITFVEGAEAGAPLTVGDKPKPQGDTYVNRRSSAPGSLNVYTTSEGDANTVTREYVLEGLMRIRAEDPSKVDPWLATSWEVAPDKLTYTYHLRRGVQFGDGRPFTAADVKFSFDVMRDPSVIADHLRPQFEEVESLETPDPHTVVVHYRKPDWTGIYAVGYRLKILNKGWFEEEIVRLAKELDVADASTSPGSPGFGEVFNKIRVVGPGTGPYFLSSRKYDKGNAVILDKNPFWWGTQVHPTWYNFDKLKWVYISDEVAAFEAFRKGEFDVSVVQLDNYDDQLSKDPSIKAMSNYYEYDHTGLGFNYIAWNSRNPPFDDPRVRKAMTHLVDREFIKREIARGRGQIATCPSKPIYPEYSKDIEPWPFSPETAAKLLAEAGWKDTNGDGVLDKNGKRFEFELKVPSGGQRIYDQLAEILKDAAGKIGVRVEKRPLEWSTFIEDYYERRFEAVALYASFEDPSIELRPWHSSADVPRGDNHSGWRNAEVDKIIDQFNEEFDHDKRTALFHQFNVIFNEEQPVTLLMHNLVGVLQNNRFEDVEIFPSGLRNHEYWVKPENVKYK